jgi:demethoxyubiquinone hydroxylase (CLK1/Coq7/Cat5 family)
MERINRAVFHGLLRLTYSSEKGAALAYRGHARAVRDPVDREAIEQIERDEWHHRELLLPEMAVRGVRPWWVLEMFFWAMGSTIGLCCRVWGEWASAKGASMFEVNGVSEYTRLAALARGLGQDAFAEKMDAMAEQEVAHQAYFAELARRCWRAR